MNMTQILLNQIKMKNPQMFNKVEEMMRTENPQELLSKIMDGYTPEQKQKFKQFANNFGITDEQLNSYGINSK